MRARGQPPEVLEPVTEQAGPAEELPIASLLVVSEQEREVAAEGVGVLRPEPEVSAAVAVLGLQEPEAAPAERVASMGELPPGRSPLAFRSSSCPSPGRSGEPSARPARGVSAHC